MQWIWNTNVYMPIDNEAGIGFLRADGTAKPELASFVEWARLLRTHATRLREPAAEAAVLLIPQSQLLSPRDFASEATRRAVRTLAYDLRTPVRAVGEYNAGEHLGSPRLIVLPSARVLSGGAWTALLAAVERGATLLITGPLELDEYLAPDRLDVGAGAAVGRAASGARGAADR